MEILNIYKKLLEIQEKGIALKKDANNPFFGKNYISLDNIIETYNPLLSELGIVCYHYTKNNKLVTVLLNADDDTRVESEFNVLNTDPQKQGSEISYGKRYNLGQLLNIQTDTDDDANVASNKQYEKSNNKEYIEDDNKEWFNDENYDKISDLVSQGRSFTIKEIRDKYKVSKANAAKLSELGIK